MDHVNTDVAMHVIGSINDGNLFEKFISNLLCEILGVGFSPQGGLKDRGIDGLEHIIKEKDYETIIYQISISSDPKQKIKSTIETLKKNKVEFEQLTYITNKNVKAIDILENEMLKKYGVTIRCWDISWIVGHINHTPGTIKTYCTYIESNRSFYMGSDIASVMEESVRDLVADPKIFVFLRQQWESSGTNRELEEILIDSLILFALEGTDPEKKIFMTKEDILSKISKIIKYSPKTIETMIDGRLLALSKKQNRKINAYQKDGYYCLPFSTRQSLFEQNGLDNRLYSMFKESVQERISNSSNGCIKTIEGFKLIEKVFNSIFKEQGLEFADFILQANEKETVENILPDTVLKVVNENIHANTKKEEIIRMLLTVIREIVYIGNSSEKEYLRRLSNSYMMLFTLSCEPAICSFFSKMASQLKVFVCTSILVPALSEYYLDSCNRRHWNLLVRAQKAGVKLFVNKVIVSELVGHIRKSLSDYRNCYEGYENLYQDYASISFVSEILIRSYLYNKANGKNFTFVQFIDNFVSPTATQKTMEYEIIQWLEDTFGISYVNDGSLDIKINQDDYTKLEAELKKHKKSDNQAASDAFTILMIYELRAKDNEIASQGILGYKTWWLSKDTITYKSVIKSLGDEYNVSCYLRPDFLLNYISLAPSRDDVNLVYDGMFPTLMGVSLSHHIPDEISKIVHSCIREHSDINPGRRRTILASLSNKLKSEKNNNHHTLKHFLDEEFSKQ